MRAFQDLVDGRGGCEPFRYQGVNRQDRGLPCDARYCRLALYRLLVPVLFENVNGAGEHCGMSEQIPSRVG